MFSLTGLRLYFPVLEPWVVWSVFAPLPFLQVYLCSNVGPQGLLAVAVLAPFVPQSTKSLGLALLVYLCVNVGPRGLLAVSLPALFIPQSASLWVQLHCLAPICPGCLYPPLL